MAKDAQPKTTTHLSPNVSSDLIWEVVRHQNAYLVKRKTGGGIQFSRDPFNVGGLHTRKHAGFVNDKAVGIVPTSGDKGGVTLITKKAGLAHKPASATQSTSFSGNKSQRKTYKSVASIIAKRSYRSDLRSHAVSRASQVKQSQRPSTVSRVTKEKKPRGKKAQREAAAKATASEE